MLLGQAEPACGIPQPQLLCGGLRDAHTPAQVSMVYRLMQKFLSATIALPAALRLSTNASHELHRAASSVQCCTCHCHGLQGHLILAQFISNAHHAGVR